MSRTQLLLEMPFMQGMVSVYHALPGWRTRRQHLSLVAPYFSYPVVMSLFGVGRWTVFSARLHAKQHGAERPVPPSRVSYRISPEKAAGLNAFVNNPAFIQILAHNKDGSAGGEAVSELRLKPEQLWNKYKDATPEQQRVSRSKFREFLSDDRLRMMSCKSCLCGPCEQYGTDSFRELDSTIRKLGLGSKEERSYLQRAAKLRDYLSHDYRRKCSLSSDNAAQCIVFALSAASAEWSCTCDHSHSMPAEMDNERFHLLDDLLLLVERRHAPLARAALAAVGGGAGDEGGDEVGGEGAGGGAGEGGGGEGGGGTLQCEPCETTEQDGKELELLEEHLYELTLIKKNLDLYVRHLMRKALSSSITPALIERLKRDPSRVLLIVDYKAKVLPGRNRETQTEAYGKKGKSLWGATAIRWDQESGDCEVLNFRIVCDDSTQTWFHTLNEIGVTLDELLAEWSTAKCFDLLSDGAGNFTCTALMTSLPRCFSSRKLQIREHVISEVAPRLRRDRAEIAPRSRRDARHGRRLAARPATAPSLPRISLVSPSYLPCTSLVPPSGRRRQEPDGHRLPAGATLARSSQGGRWQRHQRAGDS